MAFIAARLHGYLDYLTVLIFLAAPTVLGFGGVAAQLAWLLASVIMAGSKESSARR